MRFRRRVLSAAVLATMVLSQAPAASPHVSSGVETIAQSLASVSNWGLPSAALSRGELGECEHRLPEKSLPLVRASDCALRLRSQMEGGAPVFGYGVCPRASTAHMQARHSDDPEAH